MSIAKPVSQPAAVGPFSAHWIRRASARFSLTMRFAVACLVVLVIGALLIGSWIAREIEHGVVRRTSAVTALYVESFISPHLTGLHNGTALTAEDKRSLAELLADTSLGRQIARFKVWAPNGEVLFADEEQLIGVRFPVDHDLQEAFAGETVAELSNLTKEENRLEQLQYSKLVEFYSPVRTSDGRVVAVAEIYQRPDDLLAEIRDAQRRSWLVVGVSTVAMYLLLVGLVAGASRTITRQHRGLEAAFRQEQALQARIRRLNERLQRAAAEKTQTDEELLRRVSQDLHDGPAQDLALALLRIESLERPGAASEELENVATIRFALNHSLQELRDITTDLRLPQLAGLSWLDIVEKAATEHRRRTGDVVHVDADDVQPAPAPPQAIAIYRVIQEALSNASRHSGVAEQRITLSEADGQAVVAVGDHGRGIAANLQQPRTRRARLGLQGMRERIELLGGSFHVTTAEGEGTTVTARLPLDPASPA